MQYFQKLIGKEGGGLGYTLGERVPSHSPSPIWTLHKGVKKDTGEEALVFTYDPKMDSSGSKKSFATSGTQRLKTFRHPDILKFLGSAEMSDGGWQIATEPAMPLSEVMRKGKMNPEAIQWGLVCISRALGFLHSSSLIHGSFNPSNVYVTPSGDWKLGGFESTQPQANAAALRNCASLQLEAYKSPEAVRGMWSSFASGPVHGLDAWALGCLIYAVHAGSFSAPEELRNINSIPHALHGFYQRLLASNPAQRALCSDLPEYDYFKKARFVELNLFLDNLAIKDAFEKEAFLKKLPGLVERLPRDFCVNKVLPVLCTSIDMGIGGSSAFAAIVKLRARMEDEEFKKKVVDPFGAKWYSNQNFPLQMKLELLQQVSLFAKLFNSKEMNDKVFPALCNGLADQTSPALRDLTVKTCVHVAPQLNERNLNSILMSKFASLQVDPEPAIRTNTTVCIGKLAKMMTAATKQKVLIPAFARALKDPFPPARSAGLAALQTTQEYYGAVDIAQRIYPAVGPLLVDVETEVRANAFKLLKSFQPKLEKNHDELTKKAKEQAAVREANGQGQQTTSGSNTWGFSGLSSITSALMGSEAKPTTTLPASQSASKFPAPAPAPAIQVMDTTVQGNGQSDTLMDKFDQEPAPPAGVSAGDLENDDGWDDDLDDLLDRAAATAPSQPAAPSGSLKLNAPSSKPAEVWNSFDDPPQKSSSRQDDLWDMLPAAQPAPAKPASSVGARKPGKKADDDWESILGASATPKKRGPAKLGAVRR